MKSTKRLGHRKPSGFALTLIFSILALAFGADSWGWQEPSTLVSLSTPEQGDSKPPNFILMIGDDMGLETLACYGLSKSTAHTPNLDKLAASGIRFDDFWAQPVCSPTRATLLTGQYGFKNGIGAPSSAGQGRRGGGQGQGERGGRRNDRRPTFGLPTAVTAKTKLTEGAPGPRRDGTSGLKPNAFTFLNALKSDQEKQYQTAAVGKWHLASTDNGWLKHPQRSGFDYYAGPIRGGGVGDYFAWSKSTAGGNIANQKGYVTSDTVDDAVEWLEAVEDNPFFLWVAFNAPHTPFHFPPRELLSSELKNVAPNRATTMQQYHAMIEAMDSEIGRLIASLDPETLANTYLIFIGDNGTPKKASLVGPYGRQKTKGTLFQGGINVPFIVAGPGITSGVSGSLANSVDIYKTVLELAGVEIPQAEEAMHSVSLAPVLADPEASVRKFMYADIFDATKNQRAVRNERFKYIENISDNTVYLFDLSKDPFEKTNLLSGKPSEETLKNKSALRAKVVELTARAK